MQSILLPQNYQVPFDISNNAEVNAYVLEAGYKIYQTNQKYYESLNQAKHHINNSELKDEYDLVLRREKQKNQEELDKLIEENQTLKSKYKLEMDTIVKDYDSEVQQLNLRIKMKKITSEEEIERKCQTIAEKYEKEEEEIERKYQHQLNDLAKKYEEETKRSNDFQCKLHALHLASIDREKEIRETVGKEYHETLRIERERYNTLALQHSALTTALSPKTLAAIEMVNVGEEMISKWTRELFNNADINTNAAGNLNVRLHNKLFLFEIKNRINIQRPDIENFIRDIGNNNSNIHGGLFISLNSPSIPNKGDFSLEYIKEIPVIYLHVPDKATLKVAIKTLLYLNSKADNTSLTMAINQIYTNIKTISSASVSMSKNLDDARVNLDSLKREIKNGIVYLEQLFAENPEVKFETTVNVTDYRSDEIKLLCEVYANNNKAKMDDYAKALSVVPKYLQDRGGAAKIKSIVQSQNISQPSLTFNVPPPVLQIN